MAAKKNPLSDKAHELYKSGMKLVDIAAQLGLPDGTIRRWKNTYKWDNERSDKKSERSDRKKNADKEVVIAPKDKSEQNGNLSEKQRLFCLYFVKYRNKVKAYQKAYQCSYENACGHASELWKNVEIQNEINRIIDELYQDIRISIADLIQQQIDIARADINDYVDISAGFVKVRQEIDGTLIKEIKDTSEGISIKLYDKQKAIDFLKNNLPDGSSDKGLNNMQTLAEIIQHPVQNRMIEDLEENDEPSGTTQPKTI